MTLYPRLAEIALLDIAEHMPGITPTLICLHTHGGPGAPKDIRHYFNRSGNRVFSHFDVGWDGHAIQFQDTHRQAPAQWQANTRAVSIETQDDGHPDRPWTDPQLATITALIIAVAKDEHIPLRLATEREGVGYHQQFSAWNHSGHDCPGTVRRQQFLTEILPALEAHPIIPSAEEVDMFKIRSPKGDIALVTDAGPARHVTGEFDTALNKVGVKAVNVSQATYDLWIKEGVK